MREIYKKRKYISTKKKEKIPIKTLMKTKRKEKKSWSIILLQKKKKKWLAQVELNIIK